MPCSMAMLECQRDLKGNWLTRPLTLSSSWQPWVGSMRPVIAPLEDLKSQKATICRNPFLTSPAQIGHRSLGFSPFFETGDLVPGSFYVLLGSWYIMASGYLRPVVRRPIHSASQLNGWGWAWNSPQRSEVPRKVTGSIWRQRRLGPTPTWKANNLSPRGFPSGRRSSARMPAADSLPILIILFVQRETMNRKKHQINHVLPMPTLSTL